MMTECGLATGARPDRPTLYYTETVGEIFTAERILKSRTRKVRSCIYMILWSGVRFTDVLTYFFFKFSFGKNYLESRYFALLFSLITLSILHCLNRKSITVDKSRQMPCLWNIVLNMLLFGNRVLQAPSWFYYSLERWVGWKKERYMKLTIK